MMDTLDEMRKKAVVQVNNAVVADRARLAPAPAAVSKPAIQVLAAGSQMPSMGEIKPGGGVMRLDGGDVSADPSFNAKAAPPTYTPAPAQASVNSASAVTMGSGGQPIPMTSWDPIQGSAPPRMQDIGGGVSLLTNRPAGEVFANSGLNRPQINSPAVNTSTEQASQIMGPPGKADLRLRTAQDYKVAQRKIFLGRMAGDQGLSPKTDMQPVSLERNKEAFSSAEGSSRSTFNSFMGRTPITTMAPVQSSAPTEDYLTRNKRIFGEAESSAKKARDEFGLYD